MKRQLTTSSEPYWTCNLCLITYSNLSEMISHFNHAHYHYRRSVNPCKNCRILFESQEKLIAHNYQYHKKRKKTPQHLCINCNKSFVSLRALRIHNTSKHAPKIHCGQCNAFSCQSQTSMRNHINRHWPCSEIYECTGCHKWFSRNFDHSCGSANKKARTETEPEEDSETEEYEPEKPVEIPLPTINLYNIKIVLNPSETKQVLTFHYTKESMAIMKISEYYV